MITALALCACARTGAPANAFVEGGDNRPAERAPPPPQPEQEYGPEEPMTGTFTTRFEHSDFEGCWFDMERAAAAEFRRQFPSPRAGMPQQRS